MKRVIFICLLAFSACLCDQTPSQDVQSTGQAPVSQVIVDPRKAQTETDKPNNSVPNVQTQNTSVPEQAATNPQSLTTSAENTTQTKNIMTNDTKTMAKTDENKVDKLSEAKDNKTEQITDEKNNKPLTNDAKNDTKSDATTEKATDKSETNKPTTEDDKQKAANVTANDTMKATDAPALQARGFDGPSFIGGIILTLGLIAISFMGYKYYKNQTERNYYGTL